ncbi:hypothetical protein [Allorhizobium undicola]|uniref:hypothetical protein n=1 Tax=Allorhizobium undicola TaxID=78527 RepID=UPI000489BC5B|nr:hypothetical protein [Allorhizobium undicola]
MNAFRFRSKPSEPEMDLLLPERRPRPASARGFVLAQDVVDARFVTVKDPVGDLHSRLRAEFLSSSTPAHARRREMQALLGTLEGRLQGFSRGMFLTMVGLIALAVFVLALSVQVFFAAASSAPVRPLAITHVTLREQDVAGLPSVLINAIIENHGDGWQSLSPVRADIFSEGRLVASTLIEAPADGLGAGQSRGIAAKLPHPGGKTPELKLSFDPAAVSAADLR